MLSKKQQKNFTLICCYFSDITLVAWLYFISTNYNRYKHTIGSRLDSPDFELQFYQVLLQSLTFALLLFLVGQTVVYILAWRNFRSAYLYLKFFCVLGFTICLYITVLKSLFAFLPMTFYLLGYYRFAKLFKESTAILQSSPQSPKL